MKAQIRTDLASELELEGLGIKNSNEIRRGFRVGDCEIVNDEASARLGKPKGRYVTLELGEIRYLSDDERANLELLAAELITELTEFMLGRRPESILVAGLGNRRITADALGDEVVGGLTVTRHLGRGSRLFELLGGRELSAVAPGVLGQTGIETVELVRGAVEAVKPELVIAVDSLCARSTERLASTLQLGSAGISPGSGLGNRRRALDEATLGVPVLALGVPTVVDSSTLVIDALERAGIDEIPHELEAVLESGRSFFVTPKECDTLVDELARLCSGAISRAFLE